MGLNIIEYKIDILMFRISLFLAEKYNWNFTITFKIIFIVTFIEFLVTYLCYRDEFSTL